MICIVLILFDLTQKYSCINRKMVLTFEIKTIFR